MITGIHNFTLEVEIYFVGTKQKTFFYDLSQQYKQLKTMKIMTNIKVSED